jgi:hypothetical protein
LFTQKLSDRALTHLAKLFGSDNVHTFEAASR